MRPMRTMLFSALAGLLVTGCGGGDVSIGGTLSGLSSGQSITLQNNATDNLVLTANGAFTFATPVSVSGSTTTTTTATTAPYAVTVLTQPTGQTCTVTNGSGTVSSTTLAVTNVTVSCSAAGSVGVTVINLLAGGSLTVSNGTTPLTVTSNGTFVIPGVLTAGSSYTVTVTSKPAGQTCTVANGAQVAVPNFTSNIAITCSTTNAG